MWASPPSMWNVWQVYSRYSQELCTYKRIVGQRGNLTHVNKMFVYYQVHKYFTLLGNKPFVLSARLDDGMLGTAQKNQLLYARGLEKRRLILHLTLGAHKMRYILTFYLPNIFCKVKSFYHVILKTLLDWETTVILLQIRFLLGFVFFFISSKKTNYFALNSFIGQILEKKWF